MECDKILGEMNFRDGKCKFFKNTNMDLSKLLKYIDITRFDFSVLQDIPDMFKEKLNQYKKYTDMLDERIEKLYRGLKYRINNLEDYRKKLALSIEENTKDVM